MYGCASPSGAPFPCIAAPPFSSVSTGGEFVGSAANGIGVYGCGTATSGCALSSGFPIGGEFSASGNHGVGVRASVSAAPGDGGTIGVQASALGDGAVGGDFLSQGSGTGSIGVSAEAKGTDGVGVKGTANTGANAVGVLGSSTSGLAGRFEGSVHVTGKVTRAYTAGTGSRRPRSPTPSSTAAAARARPPAPPNLSSSYDTVNKRYVITIAGESYNLNNYVAVVTTTAGNTPLLATTQSGSGKLLVKIFNLSGTAVQSPFGLVVFKP